MMDARYAQPLAWIEQQHDAMCQLLVDWANINSGSRNLAGLARMAQVLAEAFAVLGGQLSMHALPPQASIDAAGRVAQSLLGEAMLIQVRRDAPLRVLLCIHMDTVYGCASPFQKVDRLDANTLRGPGVADAKGGLVVMLTALQALERSGLASKTLGFDVLINPDEELGSPGSLALLQQAARRNDVGLLFEPALPDGALVAQRKGSGGFTVVVHGRAAHVGRAFHEGRSAIHALGQLIVKLTDLNGSGDGGTGNARVTVNVGKVEGGGPINVVPDLAIARFNVRISDVESQQWIEGQLADLIARANQQDGITVELHGRISAPPKVLDEPTSRLLDHFADCGRELGVPITWRGTGGVSDGNRLAAAGLPNVDSLGVRGDHLHSPDECVYLDSLVERAKVTALCLMRLATGEIKWDIVTKT